MATTDRQLAPLKTEIYQPLEVIGIYYEAVNRGELIVFEQKLFMSMLIPVRVEYIYEINSATMSVKVYSGLKQPMAVPGQGNCTIHGISAIIDSDGTITETVAHIRTE